MPTFTTKDSRSLKLTKADKPKIGLGIPSFTDGFEGENRIQMVNGNPRLYYKTNSGWYFTGLVQDGNIPDIPTATSTQLGLIKIGAGGTVSSDGTYTATAATPAADDITGGDAAVTITTSSGNITIDAAANNSDVIFKGTDNTSDITMLTLDGSEAGNAIFNANVTVGALLIMPDVTNNKILVSDGTSYQEVALSGDATIANTGAITLAAAQTNITSIYATDLIMGEDSQTAIDFGTANEIDFKADNAARLTLTSSALYPVTNNQIDLGTSSLEFKDAFFDGTVTLDALTINGLSEQASEATSLMINGSDVVGWRELGTAAFAGTGDFMAADASVNLATGVTNTLAVGNGGTGATTLNNLITLSTHTTGNYVATLTAGALIDLQNNSGEGATPTIDVDLTECDEATIANGDYILFLDGGATGAHRKEALADLVGIMAGDNITASGITLNFAASNFKEADDVETVPLGGTGVDTLTDGGVLLGSGTGAITAMGVLSDGEMIVGDGSGDPVAESGATLRTSIGVGPTAGNTSLVTTGTITTGTWQGTTIAVNQGGTGQTSVTNFKNVLDDETWTFANEVTIHKASGDATLTIDSDGSGDPTINLVTSNNRDCIIDFKDGTTVARFNYDHANTRFEFKAHNNTSVDAYIEENVTSVTGSIYASVDVVAYYSSDPSLKENKKLISNPLDKISSIGGYSFDWKNEAEEIGHHLKGHDYGVMADEIQNIFPELVDTRSNGIRAVKYDKLVPLLIEGIKELKQELDMIKGIS